MHVQSGLAYQTCCFFLLYVRDVNFLAARVDKLPPSHSVIQ